MRVHQAVRPLGCPTSMEFCDYLSKEKRLLMKRLFVFAAVALAAGAALPGDLTGFVDLFTGTAATGHTHPAACVPFGMVQAGPDTGFGDWAYCSGYQFRDKHVYGYSLTHLSGTGCPDYGDVSVLPFTGVLGKLPRKTPIDKATERAAPGYYRVVEPQDGVEVEIAATKRTAVYRFTWKNKGAAKVLLNLPFAQNCPKTYAAKGIVDEGRKVAGEYMRKGWIPDRKVAYAFEFDRKWAKIETIPKAHPDEAPRYVVTFKVKEGEQTLLKVGLSMTGQNGAVANLAAELPGWDFAAIRKSADDTWNALFARSVCDGDKIQKTNWYTSLYHLYSQPNDWSDADGRYVAGDRKVHEPFGGAYFTTLSLWDTFRASHPLYSILTPEIVVPTVDSLLAHYKAEGRLPVLSYGGKNVDCMIANHGVPVIVDAYLKGFRFDNALAFEAITNTLTVAHPGKPKENWDLYDRYGCFPCDIVKGESVSRTLECCYDDWCAAVYAKKLGHDEAAARFAKRADFWKNVTDASCGFARGKTSRGAWRDPFDPFAFGHGPENDNDFTEGNAFQYTWHVMHDPLGLIAALGGRDAFVKKLDGLFVAPDTLPDAQRRKQSILLDITGLIGQYVHGNEPSHHVIYFYPLAGEPRKAAARLRDVFDKFYFPGPTGLCGNDDCGQMSAWYLFSAMGFYPFNPCGGDYVIGAPQLPKATLSLTNGKSFTVEAKGLSKERKFVKAVTLNGKPLDGCVLRHADILAGGTLVFEMAE